MQVTEKTLKKALGPKRRKPIPGRLEGYEMIMSFIDPYMSRKMYKLVWEPRIEHILFRYEHVGNRPASFFTYDFLLIGVMLRYKKV